MVGEIPSNSTEKVRFAIIAGESKEAIIATARELKQMYVIDTTTTPIISIGTIAPHIYRIHSNNKSCTLQYEILNTDITIAMYDMTGKCVFRDLVSSSQQTGSHTCMFPNLTQGVYSLRITQGKSAESYKIIISQ